MTGVESGKAASVLAGSRREDIHVAGADSRRLRPVVDRLAIGVIQAPEEAVDRSRLPLQLASVIPALAEIRNFEILTVEWIGPSLIGTESAETDLIRTAGPHLRTGRVASGCCGAR